MKMRFLVLWCMESVDKEFRKKERTNDKDVSSTANIDINYSYRANNGVQPLVVKREQADYLNSFSPDARLFYLAFCFVDGDGVANGIGRHILSYVGGTLNEGDKIKEELHAKIVSLEAQLSPIENSIFRHSMRNAEDGPTIDTEELQLMTDKAESLSDMIDEARQEFDFLLTGKTLSEGEIRKKDLKKEIKSLAKQNQALDLVSLAKEMEEVNSLGREIEEPKRMGLDSNVAESSYNARTTKLRLTLDKVESQIDRHSEAKREYDLLP
jgi:hypothetical protein